MTDFFASRNPRDVFDLIEAFPLAWMIAHHDASAPSIMLPLLPELDGNGDLVGLLGHVPRSHTLTESWKVDPHVLVLFQGPQGYLSPSWLSDRNWAPTWAYAIARIEGRIRFVPERTAEALERLVEAMEKGRSREWSLDELGSRYERLAHGVIGFCVEDLVLTARFRLAQDERPEVWRDLVANSPDPMLVNWMRRFGEPQPR